METDELGKTRSFYYNEMDRLIRKTDRLGRTTQYGYHGYTETEVWYQISGSAPEATVAGPWNASANCSIYFDFRNSSG